MVWVSRHVSEPESVNPYVSCAPPPPSCNLTENTPHQQRKKIQELHFCRVFAFVIALNCLRLTLAFVSITCDMVL